MKKSIFIALSAILMAACTPKEGVRLIEPLPAGVSVDSLADCMVPAEFTVSNFNWRGGNLTLKVYNCDLYDVLDVHQMKVGDTLLFDGSKMVVESLVDTNGLLVINGGLGMGGAELMGYEGGTYRSLSWDDHFNYTLLGEACVVLAEEFVIVNCGDNPTDPYDTIRSGQKLYLESLADTCFHPLNTTVEVAGGYITQITRRWIP